MRLRLAGLMASAQRSMSLGDGAREPADHRILRALGDLVDGGEVAVGGDGKAGLDDVDAHGVEQLGDFELFLMRHGGAGALLAVAQGGVEDDDAVLLGLGRGAHGSDPSDTIAPLKALYGVLTRRRSPECPGAKRPAGPQGRISSRSVPRMREAAGPALRRPLDRADVLPRRHCLRNLKRCRLSSRNKVKFGLTAGAF